jgi:hypothetical protein
VLGLRHFFEEGIERIRADFSHPLGDWLGEKFPTQRGKGKYGQFQGELGRFPKKIALRNKYNLGRQLVDRSVNVVAKYEHL